MPRKKTIQDTSITKKTTKKNIIDSMIKTTDTDSDDIIVQLPISQTRINCIINNTENEDTKILVPTPYESNSYFMNDAENISYDSEYKSIPQNNKSSNCFWCCHTIDNHMTYSMPYNYDAVMIIISFLGLSVPSNVLMLIISLFMEAVIKFGK